MSDGNSIGTIGEIAGEMLASFPEPFQEVVKAIQKANYAAFAAISYERSGRSVVFSGQIQLVERLAAPIRLTRSSGAPRTVDGLVYWAMGCHPQYLGAPGRWQRRLPRKFMFTEPEGLELLQFVRVNGYHPPCIFFRLLQAEERDRLLNKDVTLWEEFYATAEALFDKKERAQARNHRPAPAKEQKIA